ncbi:hypothetical protein BISU_2044 [Bifidobacterium subtile]|jgi:hypothetical protein|uniref:DUF4258 domain-containing protein n=2 Tax=Bifidobacterium TaxID=1678 RepID=A0A087DTJ2_9BIFI|nr:hypothetical protein BISU_2044 [Bifidobacterium subtile]
MTLVVYNNGMSIRFEDSSRRHFAEDRLDEAMVRAAMARPVWAALLDTSDPGTPEVRRRPPVVLLVCRRHSGALDDDLIEVLVHKVGPDMVVFHVMHLSDLWRGYWMARR